MPTRTPDVVVDIFFSKNSRLGFDIFTGTCHNSTFLLPTSIFRYCINRLRRKQNGHRKGFRSRTRYKFLYAGGNRSGMQFALISKSMIDLNERIRSNSLYVCYMRLTINVFWATPEVKINRANGFVCICVLSLSNAYSVSIVARL